ncbi:hypothetical protein BDV96DRAFT_159642 [Lophiotrema nucula]|uniref:Telomerase reverse transcriptase n=1 Tax=Lophiotrema nucula TaxID=690887 RepID=A0A6A5YYY4_9PLEO|nr:hypothetical protein BDV96DRAFT_159642 [Lophiotrema nucula]
MMDLLLDCGVFRQVDGNRGNYYQLSGIPVSDLKPQPVAGEVIGKEIETSRRDDKSQKLKFEEKQPGEIAIFRNRMLYAKAALNAKGGVRFGMRHIHVLNRFPNLDDPQQTVHILRYMFPRQFGMHNVFTSQVDRQETSMPFKDYTLREREIQQALHRETSKTKAPKEQMEKIKSHIPKRLRGETVALVDRLRKLNQKCSYVELLRHYCPVEGLNISARPEWRKNPLQPSANHPSAMLPTQSTQRDKGNETTVPQSVSQNRPVEQTCFTDMACPAAHVSAFCRAVIARVIPNGFWGNDQNKRIIMLSKSSKSLV